MSDYSHFKLKPVGPALGARITGIDLGSLLAEACIHEILDAFYRYKVLFFERQPISDESFVRFAEQLGDIQPDHYFYPLDQTHKVVEVRKDPGHKINIGGRWHTDRAFEAKPPAATLLHAMNLPSHGGDTLFCNMNMAFEDLSEGMKRVLCGLNAVQSNMDLVNARGKTEEFENRLMEQFETLRHIQPLVIKHPNTGLPVLFANVISTEGIDGWTREESFLLLEYLYQHAAKPENTIRYHWAEDTVALWDNLATWHYALNDYPLESRVMHRITLAGTSLEAYQLPD